MSIHLGRLEKVELRDFFKDEAKDFTPWLAQEENLELLGETLEIQDLSLYARLDIYGDNDTKKYVKEKIVRALYKEL